MADHPLSSYSIAFSLYHKLKNVRLNNPFVEQQAQLKARLKNERWFILGLKTGWSIEDNANEIEASIGKDS